MKKITVFQYSFLILFFLAFLNPFNSSFTKNLLLIKSHAEDREDENENENETNKTESRDNKNNERESDEQEDDDDNFKRTSSSVKVAPVESQVKIQPRTQTNIQPNVVAPTPTPTPESLQALPRLYEDVPLTTIPKIEVSIPTIPSNDQIKQMIDNVKDLNGVVSSINLEETANGILKGEVITKQKILGLIDIQIPYKVTLDSISGTIKEKFPKDIWNSFLDFISF